MNQLANVATVVGKTSLPVLRRVLLERPDNAGPMLPFRACFIGFMALT